MKKTTVSDWGKRMAEVAGRQKNCTYDSSQLIRHYSKHV